MRRRKRLDAVPLFAKWAKVTIKTWGKLWLQRIVGR
jgi:hypothetical protein